MFNKLIKLLINATLTLIFCLFISKQSFSYFCSKPSEPYIPDGYSADSYTMNSASDEVEYYISDVNNYIQCLNDEIMSVRSEAENVVSEMEYSISNYNNR